VPDIKPSLLHGDLWSGNVAETDDGPGTATTNNYFKLLNTWTITKDSTTLLKGRTII